MSATNPAKPTLDDLRIERRPESSGAAKAWLVVILILLALGAAAAYWWHNQAGVLQVHTAIAKAATSSSDSAQRTILNASGYVTARRQATVSAKVTGKVTEVDIEEGMKVKKDQILAKLDDSNLRTSLDVAKAQLDSARLSLEETRAQLKQADSNYDRTTKLANEKVASQADLENAESSAMTLRARIKRQEMDVTTAERQVTVWDQQIEDMIIRAPFDGVVTTKNAQPGEMISPISAGGGFTRTGIGTVVDMNSLEIELDVNESYINRVEPAQAAEATLDPFPDWHIPCHVIAIIPTADREKSTVKVRVGFDKLDPRILPDMVVKVGFHQSADAPKTVTHSLIIPKSAIQSIDNQDTVFIVEKGRAQRRQVTVTEAQGKDAYVSAGVESGEKVILDAPATLKEGATVKEIIQ